MFQALIEIAQQLLETRFLSPCKINAYDQLSEPERRNAILRLHIDAENKTLPKTVILKQSLPEEDNQDDKDTYIRFAQDWAGLEFLSSINHTEHFTPNFYGGNTEHRFVLLEDLGTVHISLVDALSRPNKAEAIEALTRFIHAIAGMHAASFGHLNVYEFILKRLHPQHETWQEHIQWRKAHLLPLLESICQILGVKASQELLQEADYVIETMFTPGPFTVLTHGDICPDNVFDHKSSKDMQLIDFEYASPRHALLDGTYLRMSMPTCWCAKAFPVPVIETMETIYKQKLATTIPAAKDKIEYQKAYVLACGFWILQQTLHFIENTLTQDRVGPSGQTPVDSLWDPEKNWVRPRVLSRLQAFVDVATPTGHLPQLTHMAKSMLGILAVRWPEIKPLEFYPAFQGK